MSYTDRKITQAEINAHHVQGATDYLIGNPQQNKAVFDNLPEFIAGKFNDLIDEIAGQHGDEIRVAVDEWLAEHPEVTTTVQDNSLTTAKYVDGSVTEPKIAEGAVTPSKLDRAYSTTADLASVNANLTNELNVLDARMDEFASLPPGSTSGNAELVDIRVGADGPTYPTAGDAVRGQVGALKSDLQTIYNDVAITWTRKVGSALGTFSSGNGASTQILSNVKCAYLSSNARSVLFLYKNGSYIGKMNANYELDKVSGSWGYYTGRVNLGDIMASNSADGIIMGLAPTDGTTITDETVQTWGDANATIKRSIALTEYNTSKEISTTWIKGLLGATGALYPNDNGVTSDFLSNVDRIDLSAGLAISLLFYKGTEYIGKISDDGTVDQAGGHWRKLYTTVKVREIMSSLGIDADSIRFGLAPVDGTTITDENAQSWGDANAKIYTSQFVIKQYFDSILDSIKDGSNNNSPVFMTINHRGYSTVAPENTLPAYALSKKNGFKYVECDLEWTSDNVPVLLHDDTINRTGRNADGTEISSEINIHDITYEQALTYDFGIRKGSQYAGTKIPSLAEFVLLCKNLGLTFMLDIKTVLTDAQIKIVADTINSVGMGENVMFGTAYSANLQSLGAIFPKALLDYGNISTEATDEQITNAITVCNSLKTSANKVTVSHYQHALTQAQYDMLTEAGINSIVWRSGTDFSKAEVLAFNKAVTGAFVDAIDAGKIIFENTMADYE